MGRGGGRRAVLGEGLLLRDQVLERLYPSGSVEGW